MKNLNLVYLINLVVLSLHCVMICVFGNRFVYQHEGEVSLVGSYLIVVSEFSVLHTPAYTKESIDIDKFI